MSALRGADVPVLDPRCVVRPQGAKVLVFNPLTDELHLIPERGFRLVQMCDGVTTLAEIEASIAAVSRETSSEKVREFFVALVERGILAVERAL